MFTLRPEGADDTLSVALAHAGIDAVNITVVRLRGISPSDAESSFRAALSAERLLFTSPAAVLHAQRIDRALDAGGFAGTGRLIQRARDGCIFAPGPGTAIALRRAGIEPIQRPAHRFDSEGVLELPGLAAPINGRFALVGAPGGRGLLEATLAQRGAKVLMVHVYQRDDAQPQPDAVSRLLDDPRPTLIVSSGDALRRLAQWIADAKQARLRSRLQLVVASPRLSALAATLGYPTRIVARSADPPDLVEAVLVGAIHRSGSSTEVGFS